MLLPLTLLAQIELERTIPCDALYMTHFAEGSALLSTNVPDSLVDAIFSSIRLAALCSFASSLSSLSSYKSFSHS